MHIHHSSGRGRTPRLRAALVTGAAIAAASTLVLTGCTGAGTASNSTNDPDAKVTLEFWNGFTGPDGPALEQVVDDFNASQDRITVKANIMPWDTLYQKVLTAASSKDGPDIVAMSASRLPQYAAEGLFQPIDDYYENPDF